VRLAYLPTNARGLWLCQKYEALQMRTQEPRPIEFTPPARFPIKPQRGAIANVASISGLHAVGLAAYTSSKYAAVGITKNGAKFYGPDAIRINAICPGWTLTAMFEHSMGEEGRRGRRLMSFLLSDESSYMNGSLVVSDGGFHDIR